MKHRFLLLSLCACVLACDSANPIAPSGTVLTASANPSQISLNGQSTITVTGFKPDGSRLNPGTQIILSTSLGNLFNPTTGQQISIVEIDANGQAGALLRADGRAGSATISATLSTTGGGGGGTGEGGSTTGTSASVTVQIGLAAEDQPSLLLTASPSVINLNQTATISALARNSDGTAVGAGQQVRLRTSLGTLGEETLTTDSAGEAQTTLSPGTITGTATVTGTVGSSAEATVTVTFGESAENRPTLTLTANPVAISPGDTSSITAQARAADGSPLSGATVLLRTSLGTLDDTSKNTGSDGQASFTLTAGNQSGDAVVTGSVGSSNEVDVTISIGQPVLLINANPSTIDVGETSDITVTARGSNGTPLVGREILLTADLGTLDDDSPVTDETGRATAVFTAGTQAGTGNVDAILGSSDQVGVNIVIRDAPDDFTFVTDKTVVNIGGDAITMTVTVVNARNELLQNINVRFAGVDVGGTFDPGSSDITDSSGTAEVTLTLTDTELGAVGSGNTFEVTATVTIREEPVVKTIVITVQ